MKPIIVGATLSTSVAFAVSAMEAQQRSNVEIVNAFNPNHGEGGRFASGDGGSNKDTDSKHAKDLKDAIRSSSQKGYLLEGDKSDLGYVADRIKAGDHAGAAHTMSRLDTAVRDEIPKHVYDRTMKLAGYT